MEDVYLGSPLMWFDTVAGAVCFASVPLGMWRSRRPSRPASWSIWNSVTFGALGLCAWFSAIASLGRMSGFWYALVMVAGLVCFVFYYVVKW